MWEVATAFEVIAFGTTRRVLSLSGTELVEVWPVPREQRCLPSKPGALRSSKRSLLNRRLEV